ncbi:S-layer homology domain-containing protein, partial [Caryophanon latum]|uniref:S-layer homology domain-containing protein n=1 Tax=Caryophanon latum TaxID=33977 RepID=UPI001B801BBB
MMRNKRKNRSLFITTSVAMAITAVAPTNIAAQETTSKFSDVANTYTHAEAINALAERNVVSGYLDGTFKPLRKLSRSDVVKMLGKFLVEQGHVIPTNYDTVSRFSDIAASGDEELKRYAAVVYDAGVFIGNEGNLMPYSDMTRENIALVLSRLVSYVAGVDADEFVRSRNTTSDIADMNRAKPEARTAIKTIEYFGLTVVSDYRPKESTNRGQFASFIYRLLINVLENEAVLDELEAYKWSKVLDVNSIKINEEGNILTAANSKPSVTVTIAKDDGTSIGSGTVDNNGNVTINLGEPVEEGQNLLITIDDNGVTYTIPYVVKDKISIPGVPSEPTNPPIEPPGGGGTVPPPSGGGGGGYVPPPSGGGGGGSTIEYATPAAIAALKELINSVPLVAVSMDGSNIPMDQNWTTLEAKQALQDALLAAEQVANKRNPTAAEIKAAEEAVKAAIDAYEDAQQMGAKEAVNMVVYAEMARTRDAYEAALERVNELPASDLKTSLLERLEAVKDAVLAAEANKKAQDLVLLAELEFTEEALQEALNAVAALLDERMKEMLENRLELIQAILDKDNERIEQARAKVSVDKAAEATFNAAGQIGTLEEAEQLWDRANAAVEALPESTLKKMLQNKLAALTPVNTAIGLVETAENAKTPAAITAAKQAVNALLANVPEKSILQQRLAALDQLVNNEAKLQEAIEAVEAVEQNPTQQGLDDARELVNALRPSEDKTALNNRLDLVEAILAEDEEGIQNGQATVSVDRAVKATAEAAKGNMTAAEAKVEVDKARALVDALPASAVKAVLEDRLLDLTRDLAATTLVEAAEGVKTQAAVDAAKQALSTLPNSANKAELEARLQDVQNALNDAKLQAAKDAVDALEKNPTIEGVESARELVNALPNSRDKNDLNARIDAVEAALEAADKLEEATNAVTDLEQNPTQPKLDEVQELVNELPDSEEKEALQDRIDAVQDALDEAAVQAAEDAVAKAEETPSQEAVDNAQELVNALPDGEKKDELQDRIDAVQDALDEAAQKLQEAKDAVAAVEANPTQKGVDDARDLVAALPDSKDKDALNNRLDLVQAILDSDDAAIKEAEAKVAVDEAIAATDDAVNGDATADEAQEQLDEAAILVDALPDSPTKTELQEELAQLQDVIDAVQAVEDAEASKTDEAKDAAQQAIDALPDGDDKTTLQNRLDELSEQPDTNTEALAAAIAKAENVPFANVSQDGTDIDPSEQWTTQAETDAFTEAIANARDVLNNPNATQEQIDAAVKQVEDAIAAYEAAKEAGTKTDGGTPTDPEAVDRNVLELAIATAEAVVKVPVSETGAEYGSTEYWTPAAALATFEQAIADAKTVFAKADATQAQINEAASTLNAAVATYNGAKKPGTHTAPENVNTDALLAAVQDAEDVFVAVSPDGTDIDPSEQWTTPEEKATLEDAIADARDVLGNADAT